MDVVQKTVYKYHRFVGQRALTIKSSLMSGCGYCHEPQRMCQRTFGSGFLQAQLEICSKEGIHT